MTTDDDLRMLDEWRHERISEADFDRLQARLHEDAGLRAELRALADIEEGLAALAVKPLPISMPASTTPISRVWIPWTMAAAAGLAALIGWLPQRSGSGANSALFDETLRYVAEFGASETAPAAAEPRTRAKAGDIQTSAGSTVIANGETNGGKINITGTDQVAILGSTSASGSDGKGGRIGLSEGDVAVGMKSGHWSSIPDQGHPWMDGDWDWYTGTVGNGITVHPTNGGVIDDPNFDSPASEPRRIGHGGFSADGDFAGKVAVETQNGVSKSESLANMVPDVARRGLARRQELVAKADEAALRGQRLLADKDFEGAAVELKNSLDLLPDDPVVEDRRTEYESLAADAQVRLSRQRAEEGRYTEAIELAESTLSPDLDPENEAARKLLEDLGDPEIFAPALTPEHIARLQKVEQANKIAQSYFRLGDLDAAEKSYNEVLNYDAYNSAARRGIENLEEERGKYYDTAYDQTRSKMLPEISELWGSKTPRFDPTGSPKPVRFPEILTATEPFSTFSLNVSDVSFKLAQASLDKGEWPEKEKIRLEEFINAFDYDDPMPSAQEKIASRNEQAVHPFLQQRNLLRISMRTAAAGRSGQTPLRLTLLLDFSGSMERADRRESVQRAFGLLAQQLLPNDQVTLIGFARQPRLLADKVSGPDVGRILTSIVANTPSEGGTNLEAALRLAMEKAHEQKLDGAQNRVVLLTDGAANLGDAEPQRLAGLVGSMRLSGIAFDAAGVGADGLNDEVLEALTRKGDGRYYFLNQPEDADDGFAKQIAGALRPAAMNVKVQVEFNPDRVGRYKLLGYEKHRLNTEDFRNDSVDAAELAAAEAGVALYQFEPLPNGSGDVGSVSVRFRDMSTGRMVENRWPIPYEPAAARIDEAAPSIRIATAAAMLAAKLKGDPVGDAADLAGLGRLVRELPESRRTDPRVQQLLKMIDQTLALSGGDGN